MTTGVTLNMDDSSALVTVAMLSALLNEKRSDYLDIIAPFVLSLLPKQKGEAIDKSKIIQGLKELYGFDELPIHVLTKILDRYAKIKYGYLEKRNSEYTLVKAYDNEQFDSNQRKIRNAQSIVMQKLQQYFVENTKHVTITIDQIREFLLFFLERNGLAFVNGMEALKSITSREYELYHVARFVLKEYSSHSEIYYHIEEVVRGFFVYKAIYYFSREQKTALKSKLKNTIVFFDTRLLIEALGYNSQEGKIAAKELIHLIEDSGGQVKTFHHLVAEVAGILTAFARDPVARPSFRLEYLNTYSYTEMDIIRLRGALETNLEKIHITAIDPIPPATLYDDCYSLLNVKELEDVILNVLGKTNQISRCENDVLSVASVFHLRNRGSAYNIENCKAILATTNEGFSHAVNMLYKTKKNNEIGYVIDHIDLTALLWLRSWDKKSNLPSVVLLENAYAACQPTSELLDTFARKIDKLQREGQISDDEALLLRTQTAPREDLLSVSQNDATSITDSTVLTIRQKYANHLTEQTNVIVEQLSSELEKEKKKKISAIEHAEEMADKTSDAYGKRLIRVAKIITCILLALGIGAMLYSNFSADLSLIWKIALSIFGLLGIVDVFRSREGFIKQFIRRMQIKKFATVHSMEIEKIMQYFG